LLDSLREGVTQVLGHVRMRSEEEQKVLIEQQVRQKSNSQQKNIKTTSVKSVFNEKDRATWGNPGRNASCPCGSGKKFKHCHGKV